MTDAGEPYFGHTSWLCEQCGKQIIVQSGTAEARLHSSRRCWILLAIMGGFLVLAWKCFDLLTRWAGSGN
ncbi:MAG: hypothetical protein ACYDH9_25505 [Limisphaerales bacterium]